LLPFEISQNDAGARLQTWFRSKGLSTSREIESPLGIYLPLWTFDLGGSLSWETQGLLFSQSRSQSVYFDDILVPAIRKILEQLVEKRDDFDLGKTVPYSSDYLANWPAETYDVALSDAALRARWVAIDSFRKTHGIGENVQLRTSGLRIETFKLILVPMWVAHFEHGGVRRRVIINGQNGSILTREFQGS
jgi:hypothetical protein